MANEYEHYCWEWSRKYLDYNVCSAKEGVSLTLGLVSVVSWGVAEVPQMITNFRQQSTDGLSLAFLMTWIIGYALPLVSFHLRPSQVG